MAIFTSIIEVVAPSSAMQGAMVDVVVRVKAEDYWGDGRDQWIAVTGRYNSTELFFLPEAAKVGALQIQDFTISFTMPGKDVMVSYGSWVPYLSNGVLGDWRIEDSGYVDIALGAEPPPNGEPPEEEPWWKNTWLIVGGIAAVAVLGIVLVRKK